MNHTKMRHNIYVMMTTLQKRVNELLSVKDELEAERDLLTKASDDLYDQIDAVEDSIEKAGFDQWHDDMWSEMISDVENEHSDMEDNIQALEKEIGEVEEKLLDIDSAFENAAEELSTGVCFSKHS